MREAANVADRYTIKGQPLPAVYGGKLSDALKQIAAVDFAAIERRVVAFYSQQIAEAVMAEMQRTRGGSVTLRFSWLQDELIVEPVNVDG